MNPLALLLSFNPSVGILWGGTVAINQGAIGDRVFQSLGRDSVGWDEC